MNNHRQRAITVPEALVRAALDLYARRDGGSVVVTTFHGGERSQNDFLSAIARNCDCQVDMNGQTTTRCRLHDALLNDQRWIDHQEFARFLRERLLEEEWRGPPR